MMHKHVRRVWVRNCGSDRIFVALPVSKNWQEALAGFQVRARHALVTPVPIRWTPTENFHCTIRFIGMLPKEYMGGLIDVIRAVAATRMPFVLPFERITTATQKDPKMIWARFTKTDAFDGFVRNMTTTIARFLYSECKGMNLVNGHRVIPHITLARCSGRIRTIKYPLVVNFPPTLSVSSVVVYRSDISPQGSIYRVLKELPLCGLQ